MTLDAPFILIYLLIGLLFGEISLRTSKPYGHTVVVLTYFAVLVTWPGVILLGLLMEKPNK